MPNSSLNKSSGNSALLLLMMVVLVVVGALGGYFYGIKGKVVNNQNTKSVIINPVFQSVNASFSGQIVKVSGMTVSIKDPSGTTSDFEIGTNATLSNDIKGVPLTSQTTSARIPKNQDMVFKLKLEGDKFKITSFQLMPLAK